MSFSIRKLFKNASYLYLGDVSLAATAFIQGIIYARTLGPAQYGVWGVVLSFAGMVGAFSGFRTGEPLTRYLVEFKMSGAKDKLRLLFATAIVVDFATGFLAYSLIFFLSPWVARSISGGDAATTLYRVYGLTTLLGFSNSLWYCSARDQGRFKLMATVPFVSAFIQLMGVIMLWQLKSLTLMNMAVLYVSVRLFNLLFNTGFLIITLPKTYKVTLFTLRWGDVLRQWREIMGFWRFMGVGYMSGCLSSLVRNGDILILGYYRADYEVGWYRLGKNLVGMIQGVGGSLGQVLYQDLNELVATERMDQIKKGLLRLCKVWGPTVLLGIIVAMIMAGPMIRFVYGEAFINSVPLFRVLLIGVIVPIILFWVHPLVLSLGLLRMFLVVGTLNTIWPLGLFVVFGYLYGALGVSIVLSVDYIVMPLMMLFFVMRKIKSDSN